MNCLLRAAMLWYQLLSMRASARELHIGLKRADVVSAPQARPSTMRLDAAERGGSNPALAWRCFDEGTRPVCFFSLASLVDFPTPPSVTPGDFVQDEASPVFDSRSAALKRCRSYWPSAELAAPFTAQRNAVSGPIC